MTYWLRAGRGERGRGGEGDRGTGREGEGGGGLDSVMIWIQSKVTYSNNLKGLRHRMKAKPRTTLPMIPHTVTRKSNLPR